MTRDISEKKYVPELKRRHREMVEILRRDGKMSIADAAERFEVSERTLRRDFDAIEQNLQIKIRYDKRSNAYVLDGTVEEPPDTPIKPEFVVNMYLASLAMKHPLEKGQRRVLLDALTSVARDNLGNIEIDLTAFDSAVSLPELEYNPEIPERMIVISDAIQRRRVLKILYVAADREEPEERLFEPVKIFCSNDEWYVFGFDRGKRKYLVRRIDRMREVKMLRDTFKAHSEEDARRRIAESFGGFIGEPVTVVFRAFGLAARMIMERSWHHSQTLKKLADGTVEVQMFVAPGGGFLRWLVSWGHEVEVLQPESVRRELGLWAQNMLELYGRDTASDDNR